MLVEHLNKMLRSAGLAAGALGLAVAQPASAAFIDFAFTEVDKVIDQSGTGEVTNTEQGMAGALWYDGGGDVLGVHTFPAVPGGPDPTPLQALKDSGPGSINGTIAAQWEFTVTGSSGDDWDAVLASGSPVQIDMVWDGTVLDDSASGVASTGDGSAAVVDAEALFFSHIFGDGAAVAAASMGAWILNNNSASTPGSTIDPVWTYMQIDDIDNLTGSSGRFAVVADDSADVLGFGNVFPSGQGAALIGTSGSGSLATVPAPATLPLIGLGGLAGLAALRRRRR